MKNKSFSELYQEAMSKPRAKTPGQEFIEAIMAMTHRSENAVRAWIMGRQIPDELVIQTIADKYGVDPKGLFPDPPKPKTR